MTDMMTAAEFMTFGTSLGGCGPRWGRNTWLRPGQDCEAGEQEETETGLIGARTTSW